jgi:hypothetical protein
MAVFHWRKTYPDLLLCARCLSAYPEVLGGPVYETGYRSQSEIDWLDGSR